MFHTRGIRGSCNVQQSISQAKVLDNDCRISPFLKKHIQTAHTLPQSPIAGGTSTKRDMQSLFPLRATTAAVLSVLRPRLYAQRFTTKCNLLIVTKCSIFFNMHGMPTSINFACMSEPSCCQMISEYCRQEVCVHRQYTHGCPRMPVEPMPVRGRRTKP